MMGSGISQVAASAGIDVVMLDRDQGKADGGKDRIDAALRRRVARGGVSDEDVRQTLSRINPSSDFGEIWAAAISSLRRSSRIQG